MRLRSFRLEELILYIPLVCTCQACRPSPSPHKETRPEERYDERGTFAGKSVPTKLWCNIWEFFFLDRRARRRALDVVGSSVEAWCINRSNR
ncbi:hypothetical protein CC86DRAFT_177878 [Ophiobolus disseminans]|uniref:Secreted protein n=1 Tax=Ophiobolus disseminans TaxID=1469910 RepID=A0A6A7A9V8_9PLEO|nr:hypothetical protein CC86DRAFT_177878 [Ophiobolus disseminans]